MTAASMPSLLGTGATPTPAGNPVVPTHGAEPRQLMDLFHQGFYMVLLLRNGYAPTDGPLFRERLRQLMLQVDRGAKKLQLEPEDVYQAKFAFSALVDEIVLVSRLSIRNAWERDPLQLEMFGEHTAGEKFFESLERLRGEGPRRVQVLEVFHMCLLLGFQGRYALEGAEKLSWLTARLGDEIMHLRGRRSGFAPHWAPPDNFVHKLRSEVPLWAVASIFALVALVAFIGLRTQLERDTEAGLATHTDIVRLAPQPAYVTITLP
jgi:type VI secretion system protein ImpK